jgi:hypothetical protein
MTEPLLQYPLITEGNKVPTDLQNKKIRDLIDVGWMSEKGLKWFGWDVNGLYAWTDANGMIYRIRDLKRNEDGKRFEKEVKNIVRGDEPRDDIHANANQLYQHEFNLCVDCQLCPDRSGVTDGDDDSNTSTDAGGEAKEEEVNVTAPPWQTFAGGGTPNYGGINTGYNPDVPGGNYGGYGDMYTEYTPPTANPGETIKTDVVTDTSKAAGGSNTPAKEGGKTTTSIDVTKSPAAPPPKNGSDIGKDIKIQEVAKIDKLRVKPNIPPQNKDIKFPTPSKPIKDVDEWFKQPDQNPANKPPATPPPSKTNKSEKQKELEARYDKEVSKMMDNATIKQALEEASVATGINVENLMAMAIIESSGNPNANKGSYKGLMQMGVGAVKDIKIYDKTITWENVQKDVKKNVMAGALYMKKNNKTLTNNNIPTTFLHSYLAHQLGANGFVNMIEKLKNNPDAKLTPHQKNNIPDQYLDRKNENTITQKQYYEEWTNKANDIWNAVEKYQNENKK